MSELFTSNLRDEIKQLGPEQVWLRFRKEHYDEVSKKSENFLFRLGCVDPQTHSSDVVDKTWDDVQKRFEKIYASEQEDVNPINFPKGWLINLANWASRNHVESDCDKALNIDALVEDNKEFILQHEKQEQNPERLFEEDEKARIGNIAIERLSEMQRNVLILKEFKGLNHAEIANRLGITEDNSKKILSRAKVEMAATVKRLTRSNE